MLSALGGMLKSGLGGLAHGLLGGLVRFGLKPIKYFIDSHFRPKVLPQPGSVVYCDLWFAVEHSGIHVADGQMANIVVTGVAQSVVRYSDGADFTEKSQLGRKIYVSCRGKQAVGHTLVAAHAHSRIGDNDFYGLVIKNCHQFSSECVQQVEQDAAPSLLDQFTGWLGDMLEPEWEPTIRQLKAHARRKLGANKWLLWDWDQQASATPEPDWQAHEAFFKNQPLTPDFIALLRQELAQTQDYEAELADEDIPKEVRQRLRSFGQSLEDVSQAYEKAKAWLQACPDAAWSYNDIQSCGADFAEMARQMQGNAAIRALAEKMGRRYLAEDIKQKRRVPQADRSEVHGVYRSSDLLRVLPSELANLDDDTLETLFYARLLENQLLSYELRGQGWMDQQENSTRRQRTGPVVACLDTSASMDGTPAIKAKALLAAIANILQKEKRELHVLLFGSQGQIREYALESAAALPGLLRFLQQGFHGGTDFASPLQRALDIISAEKTYEKADVLMISDGDCTLDDNFAQRFGQQKEALQCRVYSVLCAGRRKSDNFSDEVVVL